MWHSVTAIPEKRLLNLIIWSPKNMEKLFKSDNSVTKRLLIENARAISEARDCPLMEGTSRF